LSFCEDITHNISETKNNLTIEPDTKKDWRGKKNHTTQSSW